MHFARTAVAAAVTALATAAHATTINIIDIGGVTGSPAELGFQVAAQYWGGLLTNNATINIEIGFGALAPNVIGSTGSRSMNYSVANWQSAIAATRSGSTIDQTAVLPPLVNGGITGLTVGVDGSGNNVVGVTAPLDGTQFASRVLWENTALVKALGGAVPSPGLADARVTFNSNFAFDFNPLDGITPGTMDFLGVAIHEMGHALGFVSGVDFFDFWGFPNGPGGGVLGYDLNDTSIFSALDMFRYGAPGVLDMRPGGSPYFSIDGGQTSLGAFSTGVYHGDGRQASHFKDAAGCTGQLGIMDPTFCFGQMGEVTGLDLAAFDAMGWNLSADALRYTTQSSAAIFASVVPEPATWALLGVAAAAGLRRRPRRAAQ
jgi:hypothetical protein